MSRRATPPGWCQTCLAGVTTNGHRVCFACFTEEGKQAVEKERCSAGTDPFEGVDLEVLFGIELVKERPL